VKHVSSFLERRGSETSREAPSLLGCRVPSQGFPSRCAVLGELRRHAWGLSCKIVNAQ
jgi:hypothetical protein